MTAPETGMGQVTEGGLLGGKLRYRQFVTGHRSGFEPVLLAASIQAKPGEHVLEAGTGAGAALLCLGHRVPGLIGIGVEILPNLAHLANENFKLNGLESFSGICSDIERADLGALFDHAMANPPWHARSSSQSPDQDRALAHHAGPRLLARWVAKLTACLKPHGSLTLILPAALQSQAAACLRLHDFGAMRLLPLLPRAEMPPKLLIIAARRGAEEKILPGLALHDAGGISEAAQAILRDGEPTALAR